MLLAIVLLRVSAEYLVSWDKNLGPYDVYWPSGWVDNLVSVSSNHAGTKDAKVTITCYIEVNLTIGTYVEVTLPGFGAYPYKYSTVLNAVQLSATDNVFTFSSITMPTIAGAYGPISLIVMQGSTGQTIASAMVFSYIGVTTALPPLTYGMTVEFLNSSSPVVSELSTLKFSIPLSVNLQTYDYLIISIDTTFRTGLLTSPIWSSSDFFTATLFLATGMSHTPHVYNADGSISAQGNFVIYGLQQSVISPLTLIFTVSGFINPKYVGSVSTWEAMFMRWGTSTVLQRFTAKGPAAAAGKVTGTWVPTNGYLTSAQIASRAVTYMTLTFACEHAVPKGGTIEITFSNAAITTSHIGSSATQALSTFAVTGTSPNFLDYSPTSSIACIIAQGVVCNVSSIADLAPGTAITIHNIVTFGANTATVDITTKTGTFIVDSKTGVAYQSYTAAKNAVMSIEPTFQFINNKRASFTAATNAINIVSTNGNTITIVADIVIDENFTTGLTVNLKFPVTISSSGNDYSVSLTAGAYIYGSTSKTAATSFASSTDFTSSLVNANSISATTTLNITSGNRLSMQIAAGSSSSAASLFLPFWASSIGTRYEVLISYTNSEGVFKYFSKPIGFAPWTINLLTAKAACATAGVPLMPIEISVASPLEYTPPSGYLAYFDFAVVISAPHSTSGTIGSNFGTGLESGAVYPSNLSSGSIFLSTADTGHLLYTPAAPLTTNTLSFIVPLPGLATSATLKIGATMYANRTADGLRFNIASVASATKLTAGTVVGLEPVLLNSPKTIVANTASSSFTMESVGGASSGTVKTTVVFILEQGWTFHSDAALKIGPDLKVANSSSSLNILTSTDPAWKWSIGYKTGHSYFSSTAGNQAQLISATAPWFPKSASIFYFMASKAGGDFATTSNDACHIFAVGKIPVTVALMHPNNYSPLFSEGLGVNIQTINLHISLTVSASVSVGSVFNATVGPDFQSEGCICQIIAGSVSQTSKIVNGTCSSTPVLLTSVLAASSIISIIVFDVRVPTIATEGIIKAGFTSVTVKSSASSYPANNIYMTYYDTTGGADGKTRTSFSVGVTTPGISTINMLKVIPNNIGAKAVHLQIIFKLSLSIPSGAKLTFYGENFLADAYTRYTCWLSVGYSAVLVAGNSISFTLNQAIAAGTILEMRKDKAFTVPKTAPAVWLIAAGLGSSLSSLIKDDEATNRYTNKLVYVVAPTTSITGATLTTSIKNMYFESIHTFKFVSGVNISYTDLVIFEAPFEYDAHMGSFKKSAKYPPLYWLSCQSSISSQISCSVDHWFIICTGIDSNIANNIIDVQLWLYNPGTSLVSWNIYVMSAGFALRANGAYGVTSHFIPLPTPNIDLYNVAHDAQLTNSSTHTIFVKLFDEHPAGSLIAVDFPSIYNIKKYIPQSISCEAWLNTTTGNMSIITPDTKCAVYGNSVVFNVSTTALAGSLIELKISDVVNPASGLTRTSGVDVISKLFTNYDFWSTKFIVRSYTKTSSNIDTMLYMSYNNLNAGYTGFFIRQFETPNTESKILINKGEPISVIAGTFSMEYSITTTTGFLNAYNLRLTPTDTRNNILMFSASSYVISIERPEVWFRVGLPSYSTPGYYYINWITTEKPLFSWINFYKDIPATMVLVSNKACKFSVAPILGVSAIYGSFPIAVTLADGASPFSRLTVELSMYGTSSNFFFTPNSLNFMPGESIKFFSIGIVQRVDNGESYKVKLTLSQGDVAAFTPTYQLVDFTIGSLYTTQAVTKAYLTCTTKTNAILSLDTNSNGIATWIIYSSSLGDEYYDYDWLVSVAAPASGNSNKNQTTVAQQVEEWNSMVAEIDQTDWEEYSLAVLILSEFMYFYGQQFVESGNKQFLASFTNFIAFTSYTAAVWFDNLSGQNLAFAAATFSTAALDDPTQISLVFTENLGESNYNLIGLAVSQSLLTQSSRVISFGSLTNGRQLSTKASYLLLPSPTSPATTADAVKTLSSAKLLTNIKANGVPATSAPTVASNQLTQGSFGNQSLGGAHWNLTDEAAPEFSFKAAVAGFACCAYQVNDTTALTSDQLYFGLNQNRQDITNQEHCWEIKAGYIYSFILNLTDLQDYGSYTISCTACNDYPILPRCLPDDYISVVTVYWMNATDFASLIAVVLFMLFAYLT